MNRYLYNMLYASADADRKRALLSLELLGNHAAGIGDHSTDDFYKNAEQALALLVDAGDRVSALQEHYGPGIVKEDIIID